MDADGSDEINVNGMISFLDEPSLKQYVEALEIDASDTQLLIRLLDRTTQTS